MVYHVLPVLCNFHKRQQSHVQVHVLSHVLDTVAALLIYEETRSVPSNTGLFLITDISANSCCLV